MAVTLASVYTPSKPSDAKEISPLITILDAAQIENLNSGQLEELHRNGVLKKNPIAIINYANHLILKKGTKEQRDANAVLGFKMFLKAANETKHIEAYYQLGVCYERGIGVNPSIKEAIEYYKKAGSNHLEAKCCLAVLLLNGPDNVKDIREASRIFNELAKQKHARAYYYLGYIAEELNYKNVEKGGKHNLEILNNAIKYYSLSAELGYLPAVTRLEDCKLIIKKLQVKEEHANTTRVADSTIALHHLTKTESKVQKDESSKPQAVEMMLFAIAGKQNPIAMIRLANLLQSQYLKKDIYSKEAIDKIKKLYLDAAELGCADAYFYMGDFIHKIKFKIENKKDIEEVILGWYFMGERNGSLLAMQRIAHYIRQGFGWIQKNPEKAFAQLEKAAKGLNESYQDLKKVFILQKINTEGRIQDYAHHFDEYNLTCVETEAALAAFEVAECYEQGLGTKANMELALNWYHVAASMNFIPAMKKIAIYYLDKNPVKAKNYFYQILNILNSSEASDKIDTDLLYYLGYCHEHGIGVPKNITEASRFYWLSKSNPRSACALGIIYLNKVEKMLKKKETDPKSGKTDKHSFLTSALSLFKDAAMKGYIEAEYYRGLCYEMGYSESHFVNGDAKFWKQIYYTSSASFGFPKAIGALIKMSDNVIDTKELQHYKSIKDLFALYEKLQKTMGTLAAKYEIIQKLRKEGKNRVAVQWIQSALQCPPESSIEMNQLNNHYQIKVILIAELLKDNFEGLFELEVKEFQSYYEQLKKLEFHLIENGVTSIEHLSNGYFYLGLNLENRLLESNNISMILSCYQSASNLGHITATGRLALIYQSEQFQKQDLTMQDSLQCAPWLIKDKQKLLPMPYIILLNTMN